jgi:hypothetical protein
LGKSQNLFSAFNATSTKNSGYVYTVPADKYSIRTSDFFRYAIEHLRNFSILPKVMKEMQPADIRKKALLAEIGTRV